MSQATLPVRTDDPATFHAAALKASRTAHTIRPVVLEIIREQGPLTHDELIGAYHVRIIRDPDTPRASESGIRTRLSELRKQGLVRADTTKGSSLIGNAAKRWVAVDVDALDEGDDARCIFGEDDEDLDEVEEA